MSRFFGRQGTVLNNIARQSNVQLEIEEVKQQFATPTEQDNVRPSNTDGENGDKKVIVEGNQEFLYVKVNDGWKKTQLQEVEI